MDIFASSSDYIEFYLGKLREGDFETAFHALSEVGPSVIPRLIEAFQHESDPNVRAELVDIVWNYRQPETVAFLKDALFDKDDQVWKKALDGMVALASPSALRTLQEVIVKSRAQQITNDEFRKWVEEAILQVQDSIDSENGRTQM
jgi:HEAT repeat protein